MAGEDLGSVYYTVDAQTTGVLKVKTDVESTVDAVEGGFRKVDTQISKTAKSVKSGMSGVGRSAGQAGIQLQQFIGQIQGGQSAMLALSQQSADLGFVLGAPLVGAIVGISSSIAGLLLPELFKSSDAIEDVEKAVENLRASMTLSADFVANYSEEMRQLKNISEALFKIKLATLIAEQEAAFKKAAEGVSQSISGLRGSFDTFNDVIKDTFGSISREAISAFTDLNMAATSLKIAPTVENINKLEGALSRATEAGINNTEQGRNLSNQLTTLIAQYKLGEITLEKFNKALEGSNEGLDDGEKKLTGLVDTIQKQAETLGFSRRELALYAAEQEGATDTEIQAINAAYDKIEAYEVSVKLEKERKNAIEATNKALERMFRTEEAQAQAQSKRNAERESKRAATVTGQVEGIAESADPVTQLQAQREKQLALVREYEQLETAEHQVAVDARKAIDDEYNAKLAAAQEARFVAQSESNRMLIDGINSLGDTASNVLTGMLTQTLDLRSAMLGFANAVLNSAVNAIIQMGIEYVKAAVIGQAADQAAATAKATTQAAAAAQHTAAVTATVAELTSLAAAGAFAATAAIPYVGPAAAPAAAAAAGAATSGIGAAAIAAAPIAGMRLYGGPTSPNSLYKVTEDGRAEMFSDGRDSFLMTGSRGGAVTSNGDLGKSETPINIVVNNNAPNSKAMASYDQESRTVTIAVNEIGRQFRENKGAAFDGLVAGTTANGRAI